jgi:succinate dehydrogenase / fumarate reductase, flavoprotein subunit
MAAPRIIVVGGGLAGLAAVIKIAEAGGTVDLFSIVPVKRSHSVCAQGGINAAKNLKGEGDTTAQHFDDTIYGGDFLANQTPVKAMCEAAPAIIDLLDRMGVPFNRTPEGLLDFRRFGGTLYHRTAFAGATTGQQLLYALDEQVRRYEAEGKVHKFEGWEFLSAIIDGKGNARGIVAMNLRSMELKAFARRTRSFWRRAELGRFSGRARTRWCARDRRSRPSSSKVRTTPTASSSRCIQHAFPARTSCG